MLQETGFRKMFFEKKEIFQVYFSLEITLKLPSSALAH